MALLRSVLGGMFRRRRPARVAAATAPARLEAAARPARIYAIGDVHGCLDALLELEAAILDDAADVAGEKWIVHLGDYIDRGPGSAAVIDHLLAAAPEGFTRICLRGNHEAMLLEVFEDPAVVAHWLALGGDATLASYGVGHDRIEAMRRRGRARTNLQVLEAHIPDEHLEFFRGLPLLLAVPGFVFVHAGLRPGVTIEDQGEEDLLWIRDEFLLAGYDFGAVVIHGHTPAREPFVSTHRIGLDTGCFMTGRLTALRIDQGGDTRLLQTGRGTSEAGH